MAIKMRVLYNSAKPKVKNIANEIKAHYDLGVNAVDVIPPAYSCDKERIVVLILSAKGEHLDDSLRLFCQELTKARAQNIALMVDGNEAADGHLPGEVVHMVAAGCQPLLKNPACAGSLFPDDDGLPQEFFHGDRSAAKGAAAGADAHPLECGG